MREYEEAIIVTIFAVFFPLMFATLNDNFIPQEVVTPVLWATVVSAGAIISFTVLSFLVFFYYLYSLYRGELKNTWTPRCKFTREFVKRSGRRILAIGGAPLGVFYGVAFTLYSILRGAFEGGPVPYRYAYTIASFAYFTIWAWVYINESYYGRKEKKYRNKGWSWYYFALYIGLCVILIDLWWVGIFKPKL